jgi:glycosyltransferase involved in cell wall biosynthesis
MGLSHPRVSRPSASRQLAADRLAPNTTVPRNTENPAGETDGEVDARHSVILIGEYRFPDGDAAAIRSLSLACAFRDLGYAVTVLGKGSVREADFDVKRGGFFVKGIEYRTMNPVPVSFWRRIFQPWQRARLFVTTLETMKLDTCRAIVINACDSARHVPFVRSFCARRGLPLVGDVCEWYDPRQITGGRLNPFYLVFLVVFHTVLPRLKNVIVVSRLLEDRFTGPGRNVVRIPAPIDLADVKTTDQVEGERVVLLYAGAAGRKDCIAEIVLALASLTPNERSRLQFRLLGPTRADLEALLGSQSQLLDELGDSVVAQGRVPRSEVLQALQTAHFSVLFRPNLRYARAGFPSKVPESLAAGTPILLNLSGDLGDFLADGEAAIIARSESVGDIVAALRRVLSVPRNELHAMRGAARRVAETSFDYRISMPALASLMARLR